MGRFPEGTIRLVAHRVAEIVVAMDRLTHYELLEVDPAADTTEINRNYTLMVQAYREIMAHPECPADMYENLSLLCQRLAEAAWVLADPGRREAYDGRAAQRRVRREESLHPITRYSPSGELELEDGFEVDGEPTIAEFTPLRHGSLRSPPAPEPALGPSGQDERGTQCDEQFTAETVGFGQRPDTLVTGEHALHEEEERTVVDKDPYLEEQTVPMKVPPAAVVGGDEPGDDEP